LKLPEPNRALEGKLSIWRLSNAPWFKEILEYNE
jgi:hypothetical protein